MARRIAWGSLLIFAAFAVVPAVAAQGVPPGQVPPQELGAALHHQPTQAEVDERERALHGDDAAAARRAAQQQATVDRLYRQLTGRSPNAPLQGGSAPAAR